MAMFKYGHASVVATNVTPDDWVNKVYKSACSDGQCRMKTAKTVVAKYSPDRFLLSHVTIIASVDTELANPKEAKSDYFIKPEFSKFVNNNGDAWSKGVILNSYKTFIGGDNFLEHVQEKCLSKGKIVDAAPREIIIGKDKDNKDLSTIYVDILVATDRRHEDLVKKIELKELSTLSMGCLIKYSICSRCGNKAVDETQACDHVRFQKNNTFFDDNGTQRKIAELCGHQDDPESVQFIEASWVAQPAFTGAVLRDFVAPSEEIMAKLESAAKKPSYQKKPGDYLKAAAFADIIAQDPPKEEADAPAPTDTEDAPEPPPEEPAADAPAGDEPAAEAPPMPEPEPESDLKVWKKDLKKQVMKQITDEVMKDLSEENAEGPSDTTTYDETLIKPASASTHTKPYEKFLKEDFLTRPASLVLNKVWGAQKSWDRYIQQKISSSLKSSRPLDKKSYDKLRYGVHIAMTNSDLTALKDYGYNKREFLAVLSFIDGCLKKPLPMNIKKTIASMGGTDGKGPVELCRTVVAELGRKLTIDEARKTLSWLKLLDSYN